MSSERVGITGRRPVDERGGLHDDVPHGRSGGPGRGQEVHRPDDVYLVEASVADPGRIRDHEGVEDGVDLGCLHDAVDDRVVLVGAHEFGPLEGNRGGVGAHAQDHFEVRVGFESLDHPPAPEGVGSGDEDALCHDDGTASRTTRCGAPQHVVDGLLNQGADALGFVHHPTFGVALLVRRHIEGDGVEDPQGELGREGHRHAERAQGEDVGRDREVRETQQPWPRPEGGRGPAWPLRSRSPRSG